MDEVLSQLDGLLFSSVECVLVESVEVTDTVVRIEARTTAGRGGLPGVRMLVGANTWLLPAVSA
ncbi:hypothetical protein [Streptomyces sp. V4I2]|uniref:hypothetical protein n=1 Tax=Streptomyces sp. V4I2 TaxID=3042280 RepID=UPI002783C759|nr:hypothetical protein [Streptomyces sp. V4I2]MDQ1049194.1 hypothetical protein [Streptomyces sp. V4I2]